MDRWSTNMMMKLFLLISLLIANTLVALPSELTQADDPFAGSFSNQQYNIGVRIEKVRAGYGGEFIYQGERYPLTAFRVAGLLTGEYIFQGRKVAFSILLKGERYTLTSEGVELPIVRTPLSTSAPESSTTPPQQPSAEGGSTLRDPQGAYTFQAPSGWTSTAENEGFILRNSGTPVTMIISPHQESNIDQAIAQAGDINNPAENTSIRVRAKKLNANTAYALFQGRSRNQPVNLELVTVFSPYGGGLVVTINYGNYSPNPQFLPIAEGIAASARFTKRDTPPLVRQWSDLIRGKKLLFLQTDSYGSQRIDINLYANGSYDYQNNTGMMSQGGVGTGTYGGLNRNSGSWKVSLQGGTPTLTLSGNSGVTSYSLSPGASAQQILLNNRRYFIQSLQ